MEGDQHDFGRLDGILAESGRSGAGGSLPLERGQRTGGIAEAEGGGGEALGARGVLGLLGFEQAVLVPNALARDLDRFRRRFGEGAELIGPNRGVEKRRQQDQRQNGRSQKTAC